MTSAPQHLDARLLEDGEALEAAWGYEIATLILMKRLRTPEADAAAKAARAATALIVDRIEAANAMTLDGLKVKARAVLWTRDGEPRERQLPTRKIARMLETVCDRPEGRGSPPTRRVPAPSARR